MKNNKVTMKDTETYDSISSDFSDDSPSPFNLDEISSKNFANVIIELVEAKKSDKSKLSNQAKALLYTANTVGTRMLFLEAKYLLEELPKYSRAAKRLRELLEENNSENVGVLLRRTISKFR